MCEDRSGTLEPGGARIVSSSQPPVMTREARPPPTKDGRVTECRARTEQFDLEPDLCQSVDEAQRLLRRDVPAGACSARQSRSPSATRPERSRPPTSPPV